MNRFLSIFAMCTLAAMPSFAQFDTAEVLGTVRDQSGGVVPKAALTLLNMDTGIAAKTTGDESGNYTFSNVTIGRYKVTVEARGFSTSVASDITVNVGARQRVGRVEDWRGVPKVRPSLLLPVSSGSASIAEP